MIRLVSFLLAAFLVTGEASAALCPQPPSQPRLRVEIDVTPPGIDRSHSRQALQQFDISLASPYAHGSAVHVNGLMRGAISLESNSTLAWQGTSDGGNNCFWYDEVLLKMKLSPTIYVAAEIPKDTCLYREVLAHEYKHYSLDFAVMQDFQIIFQDELDRYLSQIGVVGPFTAENKEQAQKDLGARLEIKIQSINNRLKAERLKRQSGVDTLDEYERVARACPHQSSHTR